MPDPLYAMKPPHGPLASAPTLPANGLAVSNDVYRLLFGDGTNNHVLAVKHNVAASAAPTTGDDSADGYSPGSLWIDTTNDLAYICRKSNAGAAVWQLIGSSSSSGMDITGLTAADPADGDELPAYDVSATGNRKVTVQRLLGLSAIAPGGRLTLSSTLPVADTTGSTLYYLPFVHYRVPLWDGTRWLAVAVADGGVSVALSGLTPLRPYDVFGFLSSGALALEYLAWSSDTARATGISIQDGRYCKSGDKTRLYLGTFYANDSASTVDSESSRWLWNAYNRRPRAMRVLRTSGNWTYATNTWRSANADAFLRVRFVVGVAEDAVVADVRINATGSGSAGAVGIGLDQTAGNDAQIVTEAGPEGTVGVNTTTARYNGRPAAGAHYLQWIEKVRAGTMMFRADLTPSSGLEAEVWA